MRPALADTPVMHDNDIVRVLDRREAVGYHDRSPAGHQLFQGVLDPLFGFRINIRCGLVQNQDGRIKRQRPREGQQLSLSSREGRSALADPFVVTVRKPFDEFARVDLPRGLANLPVADLLAAQPDITLDIARENEYVLLHLPDGAADLLPRHFLNINAVNQDFALLNLVVPPDQVQNRRFARARGPYKRHLLSRLDHKTDVF